MWDASLVSRVRDRKLNEILIFASMAKIDADRIDDYIDIIVSLGDDIDACDTLLDTCGEAEVELEPITREEYLSRLSPGERADEDAFNALKSEPSEDGNDLEYVRRLISDAVESIVSEKAVGPDAEAMRWELDGLRDAFHNVLSELNESRAETASLRSSNDSLSAENADLRSRAEALESRLGASEAKLREVESGLEEADSERRELRSAMEGMASSAEEAEGLRAELANLREANSDLSGTIERIRADAERASAEHESSESELRSTIDDLRSRMDDALASQAQAQALGNVVAKLREANNQLTSERDSVRSELDSARERIGALESELEDSGRRLSESESAAASLAEENRSLTGQVSLLQEGCSSLRSERDRLESEAASLRSCQEDVGSLKEALASVRDELRAVRERNEGLSAELDYCKEALAEAESARDEAIAERDYIISEPSEPMAPVADEGSVQPPAEEPGPSSDQPVVDRVLSEQDIEDLGKIAAMKDRKTDEFIDRSMDGSMREDVCDDIVTFLKVDEEICRSLAAIDCHDFDSIVNGFRSVLDILEDAPETRFQRIYLSSLTPEERRLEDRYVEIMAHVHDVISSRYMPFMGRTA